MRGLSRACEDRVWIREDPPGRSVKASLWIPPPPAHEWRTGVVLQVGPGWRITEGARKGARVAPEVTVGDHVVYSALGPAVWQAQPERIVIANERHHVVAVIPADMRVTPW